jgi:hypothetical protein
MPTLLELTNDADALQKRFEAEAERLNTEIAERKLQLTRLHNGMHRKVSSLQKTIAKAAEANAKTIQ